MIACLDVHYSRSKALAACIVAADWNASAYLEKQILCIADVQPYQPGQFYLRELPCLLQVIEKLTLPFCFAVIDGYVWLDNDQKPGLGAHLHKALAGQIAVIGVAKNRFRGNTTAIPVLRGASKNPLYVTAAGINTRTAAGHIVAMNGRYRIPTLIKEVDQLTRREKC